MTPTTGPLFSPGGPLDQGSADLDVPTRLLVLGMVHQDGLLDAAEVYPVAEACGQSPDQIRSCLRRLVAEGLFVREGEGREARYEATADGLRTLHATLDRARTAYLQDAAGKAWDRRWRLVGFAIPEAKRQARDAFRDALLDLGGAAVQPGLYVSPHRWTADARQAASRLGVADHVTTATTDDLEVAGERDPRALSRRLWPLEAVAERYERFIDRYGSVPVILESMRGEQRRLSDAEFLPGSLVIGLKFQECFASDPLLPPELLPKPWPGRQARELLARSRRLGNALRQEHGRSQLFAPFDDLLAELP